MKLVVAIKILPSCAQAEALTRTITICNEAATWLALAGHNGKIFRQYDLHKLAYTQIRSKFGLSAQMTVRTIAKVADAFKTCRDKPPQFRKYAAQPYDTRILRIRNNSASIWTVAGRISVPIVIGDAQSRLFQFQKGEVDLCFIRNKWYLAATCDVPETEEFDVTDWLGIDFGITNIAVNSDGIVYSGKSIEARRIHLSRRRRGLQKCGTKAAKRRLRKLSGKQRRFQKQTNHEISKALVLDAERTKRGIVIENLRFPRNRVSAIRSQRARISNWSFSQLRRFIAYKAKLSGVPLCVVDPRNSSRECSSCGHIAAKNRQSQSDFRCLSCGHTSNADLNAAINVRNRAMIARGVVMSPEVLIANMR